MLEKEYSPITYEAPGLGRKVRQSIELGFKQQIEIPLFRFPGLIREGVPPEEVRIQIRQFIADIRQTYGQLIPNLKKEDYNPLASILAEGLNQLPQKKVFKKDRLNLVAARIMARTGIATKHIASELGKDWETVLNWTHDIKGGLQDFKQKKSQELVKEGLSVSRVAKMLGVRYQTVTNCCREILDPLAEKRRKTILEQRELADLGFWPSYIAEKYGIHRSTALRHVKGHSITRKEAVNIERKDREETIRAIIKENPNITKTELARRIRVKRDTISQDISRLKLRGKLT